jgi:Mn2+/Fe2+ NRAMP family transporter
MGACGVTLHAIVPIFDIAAEGKIFWGIVSSLVGLAMVWAGGFRLFEKVMGACIGLMFVSVVVTAILLWPGTKEVFSGLAIPTIPDIEGEGIGWTVALIGGIGGTLTILCYGYWIREKGRVSAESIKICRVDLAVGYSMTILFGLAMVMIGSTIKIEGQGAGLLITLADRLEEPLGLPGRWMFLIGAFGAVFSSLLGVWQAVPYLFADIWRAFFKGYGRVETKVSTGSSLYRTYLIALALIPMAGLFMGFKEVQKLYAIIGAAFIPLVALALLILNGRRKWMGQYRSRPLTAVLLLATVGFFILMAWMDWTR